MVVKTAVTGTAAKAVGGSKRRRGFNESRYSELKAMLEERKQAIALELQGRVKGVKQSSAEDPEPRSADAADNVNIAEDIEFALIQMKAETLAKVNEALSRLQENRYGTCPCGKEIAASRLMALPFAIRCRDCEATNERAIQRDRQIQARPGRR